MKFKLPELKGISKETVERHLGLYAGYVKNTNLIWQKMGELAKGGEDKNALAISELMRRFSFEFDGMRNHEYFFSQFEGGAKELPESSKLKEAITKQFGSFENWLEMFKMVALMRGVGWAFLYYDRQKKNLAVNWVEEHHLGQLTGLEPILVLDMWEHAFYLDFAPAEKKKYVEAFFENLNWEKIEENFERVAD